MSIEYCSICIEVLVPASPSRLFAAASVSVSALAAHRGIGYPWLSPNKHGDGAVK